MWALFAERRLCLHMFTTARHRHIGTRHLGGQGDDMNLDPHTTRPGQLTGWYLPRLQAGKQQYLPMFARRECIRLLRNGNPFVHGVPLAGVDTDVGLT